MLNHLRQGTGEPYVLLHPLGGELCVWDPVLPRLGEYDAIAPDLPGFGASPELAADEEATPQALARSVASFMDELGVETAHVAGISLGGWVALELAKLGRARSVCGLCSAGFWGRPLGPRPNPVRELGGAIAPLVGPLMRNKGLRERLLAGVTAHPDRVPAEAAARLVRAYLSAPGFERANAAMRSAVFSGIEQIEAPVTLAWADRDRLVGEPRGGVRGARSVRLRDCGHLPTWDDPDQVAGVLRLSTQTAAAPTGMGSQ